MVVIQFYLLETMLLINVKFNILKFIINNFIYIPSIGI